MTTNSTTTAPRVHVRTPRHRLGARVILGVALLVALVMVDLMLTWLRYSPRIRTLAHDPPGLTNQMVRDGLVTLPDWVNLDDVPGVVACAVLISEDPRFQSYSGVDWRRQVQIVRIMVEGDRSPGGSGIAQQLARNLYLTPRLTPRRKLREWLLAINIGRTLSPERQLELYLNVVEWGPTAWGVEQGVRELLGKSLDQVTPSDAVLLAVALPAPARGFDFALRPERRPHVDRLVRRLWERGVLTDVESSAAAARLHQWIAATHEAGSPGVGRDQVTALFGEELPWRGPPVPRLDCAPGARWTP